MGDLTHEFLIDNDGKMWCALDCPGSSPHWDGEAPIGENPVAADVAFALDLERVIKVLLEDGWTCEYHEPDTKCEVCQRLHKNTAERILAALGITDTCPTCKGTRMVRAINYMTDKPIPGQSMWCPTCDGGKR